MSYLFTTKLYRIQFVQPQKPLRELISTLHWLESRGSASEVSERGGGTWAGDVAREMERNEGIN